jgi:HSP20 family protein
MLGRDPFEALFGLQRALDEYAESPWLGETSSGSASYPPLNVFRKGDDFIVIAELPGVVKADLVIQIKDSAIRIAGNKRVNYPEEASVHRRERASGQFLKAIDGEGMRRAGLAGRRHIIAFLSN